MNLEVCTYAIMCIYSYIIYTHTWEHAERNYQNIINYDIQNQSKIKYRESIVSDVRRRVYPVSWTSDRVPHSLSPSAYQAPSPPARVEYLQASSPQDEAEHSRVRRPWTHHGGRGWHDGDRWWRLRTIWQVHVLFVLKNIWLNILMLALYVFFFMWLFLFDCKNE